MKCIYLLLLAVPALSSPSTPADFIKTWRGVEGPPLSPKYRNLMKRSTNAAEDLVKRGQDMIGTLSFWLRVYLLPKKELYEQPDCGLRNIDETFDEDPATLDAILPRKATNECWWGCKWVDNPYYPKEWKDLHNWIDKKNIAHSFTIVSVDPKIPDFASCLEKFISCIVGLQSRIQQYYTILRDSALTLASRQDSGSGVVFSTTAVNSEYPVNISDFCRNRFINDDTYKIIHDANQPPRCQPPTKDIQAYNTMYIACYLYILDKEGSLLYGNRRLTDKKDEVPIPVLYSRDHTTMAVTMLWIFTLQVPVLFPNAAGDCTTPRSTISKRKPNDEIASQNLQLYLETVVSLFQPGGSEDSEYLLQREAELMMIDDSVSSANHPELPDLLELNNIQKKPFSSNRIFGSSSDSVFLKIIDDTEVIQRYPWSCSLRTRGYRSYHKCGVTLLAVPPQPIILVSAAHCNYVCKDGDNLVETCCCRTEGGETSCKNERYHCGSQPKLYPAKPEDLIIVCGEFSSEVEPELHSPEIELYLEVIEVISHPLFSLDRSGKNSNGILDGYDISVYRVNETGLTADNFTPKTIYPVCFPKETPGAPDRGILAGWRDPEPTYYQRDPASFGPWRSLHKQQQIELEEGNCKTSPTDPTIYPPNSKCFRDPSMSSCVQYGASGSGVVKETIATDNYAGPFRFQGPLSFSRGCDLSVEIRDDLQDTGFRILGLSSNPVVFTDAACFMDWISAQYGYQMPSDYKKPASCTGAAENWIARQAQDPVPVVPLCHGYSFDIFGENGEFNLEKSLTGFRKPVQCDQNLSLAPKKQKGPRGPTDIFKCIQEGDNKYALNIYTCRDNRDRPLVCQNDCPGVEADGIIIGGLGALAATAVSTSGLVPLFGSTVGLAGVSYFMRSECRQKGGCVLGGRCCPKVRIRGRLRCPRRPCTVQIQ